MKNRTQKDLMKTGELVRKSDGEDDPNDIVTKALGDLTKTVEERFDKSDEEAKKLGERLDKVEVKSNRATGEDDGDPDAEIEAKAFGTYLRLGAQTPADDLKALTVSADPQAGYLAPPEMSSEFVRDLVEFSPVRAVASVRTTGAPSVKYPKRTGVTNAQWDDEVGESEESGPSFGQLEVIIHKLTTHVDISNELLADSGGLASAEVNLALSEDFGQKEALSFVNGSGSGQPEGFMTHEGIASHVNGNAAEISPDQMIKLMYSLPAAYRNQGTWMMNGTTLAAIRTLKDGDGRFLWQPSFTAGQPETILGRPVVEAVDMPDIAANATPMIYGDFSAYRIVDRLALSVMSDPYTQANRGVTRIHATRRVGGRVLQAERFKKLKMSTS